jgi:hypothetical protein
VAESRGFADALALDLGDEAIGASRHAAIDVLRRRQVLAARIVAVSVMQDLGIAAPRETGYPSRPPSPAARDPAADQVTSCLRSFMLAGRVDAARRPLPLRSTILRATRWQHARRAAFATPEKNSQPNRYSTAATGRIAPIGFIRF